MTIAAGMLYNGGVLLCADTQFETSTAKSQDPKVGSFEFPSGKVAYAMAGNGPFAKAAIQKCNRRLQRPITNSIEEALESVHEKEYRRHVLQHPSHAYDVTLHYWLLLAVWVQGHSPILYSTSGTAMLEVDGEECLGVGQDIAQYIIKPSYYQRMSEGEALILSTHALACAKRFAPSCGGPSQVLLMRNDGSIDSPKPDSLERREKRLAECDKDMRTLLLKATDLSLEYGQYENLLSGFTGEMRRLRKACQAEKDFVDRRREEAEQRGSPIG
jgi:20S proteasome alpha/beta subunit